MNLRDKMFYADQVLIWGSIPAIWFLPQPCNWTAWAAMLSSGATLVILRGTLKGKMIDEELPVTTSETTGETSEAE